MFGEDGGRMGRFEFFGVRYGLLFLVVFGLVISVWCVIRKRGEGFVFFSSCIGFSFGVLGYG